MKFYIFYAYFDIIFITVEPHIYEKRSHHFPAQTHTKKKSTLLKKNLRIFVRPKCKDFSFVVEDGSTCKDWKDLKK